MTNFEKIAQENETCRKIVKEINNFGVTQRQMLAIIYFLSLELEDPELMSVLAQTIKELTKEKNMLLSDISEIQK